MATRPYMILKYRQSRESDLLCSRDHQSRDRSICVTLAYGEYSLRVQQALYVEPFQAWQYYFWCRGSRLMINTPLMDEQEFCMPIPLIMDFLTLCFS